jgi:hypothetical protein
MTIEKELLEKVTNIVTNNVNEDVNDVCNTNNNVCNTVGNVNNQSLILDNIDLSTIPVDDLIGVYRVEKGDYLIPISLASELKGISEAAIYAAIKKGKIKGGGGVLLSSLRKYKVDKVKRKAGVRGSKVKADRQKNLNSVINSMNVKGESEND